MGTQDFGQYRGKEGKIARERLDRYLMGLFSPSNFSDPRSKGIATNVQNEIFKSGLVYLFGAKRIEGYLTDPMLEQNYLYAFNVKYREREFYPALVVLQRAFEKIVEGREFYQHTQKDILTFGLMLLMLKQEIPENLRGKNVKSVDVSKLVLSGYFIKGGQGLLIPIFQLFQRPKPELS